MGTVRLLAGRHGSILVSSFYSLCVSSLSLSEAEIDSAGHVHVLYVSLLKHCTKRP